MDRRALRADRLALEGGGRDVGRVLRLRPIIEIGVRLYVVVKATRLARSSVAFMPAMMTSYLPASSAGMMPSQSCATKVHFTFIFSQSALP